MYRIPCMSILSLLSLPITQAANNISGDACSSTNICHGLFEVCEFDTVNNVSKCLCLPGFFENNGDCIHYGIFMHALMMFSVVMISIAILCISVGVIISVVIICIPSCSRKCGRKSYPVEKDQSEPDPPSHTLPTLHERRASGPYETLETRVDINPEHPYYTTETITEYESIDNTYENEAFH